MLKTKKAIYEFISTQRHLYPLTKMCLIYDVSRHGFNSWKRRGICNRIKEDQTLYGAIYKLWKNSGQLYGSPKITHAIRAQGIAIGQKRVARLMRQNAIKARVSTLYRATPGLEKFMASIPNRERKTPIDGVNSIWVGDITYLKVKGEWRYLAVVLDKHSRRVIGWSLGKKRNAELTVQALSNALRKRKPKEGCVFHSDRGIEYRAFAYSKKLAKKGIIQSMNRPMKMNDNAHMESFFHNFKAERIHGKKPFIKEETLRGVITQYVGFYNKKRIHSSLGYLTPEAFERRIES